MNNFWQKIQRQFFSYSRSDRNAVIILSVLLLLVMLLSWALPYFMEPKPNDFSALKAAMEEWEKEQARNNKTPELSLFEFNPNTIDEAKLDTLDLPAFIKQNIIRYRKAGGNFETREDLRRIYGMNDSIFLLVKDYIVIPDEPTGKTTQPQPDLEAGPITGTFDPNNANADTLKAFGLSTYQANNLISYRSSGAIFTTPRDLLKIYGIDSVFLEEILPFIEITLPEEPKVVEKVKIEKVELNSADTTALIALPGIGSVYAGRIIKYRDLLGGFYSTRQLLEVYNFPSETFDQVSAYVYTDTMKLTKIRINFGDYGDLIRHPYLNSEQVKAILVARNKNGSFKNLKNVEQLKAIDAETFSRVKPYITCR